MAARHNYDGIFNRKSDCWRQTHVTTFGGGGTSLLLPPGAENRSYATDKNVNRTQLEYRRAAHLPYFYGPSARRPLKSVTHGQCNARPTVTFPAAVRHRPLAGTKLYCLVTGRQGCE